MTPSGHPVVDRLARARRVDLTVLDAGAARTLTGSGRVEADADPDGALVLREQGRWSDAGGSPVPYRDAVRWSPCPGGSLEVAHVRRGETRPVFLVELVDDGAGKWAAREPHRCGDDRYDAWARLDGSGVELRWRVRGPSKDQTVTRRYR